MLRFLLACLLVAAFDGKRTRQKVLATLESLSKGSAALDEAYADALKRIDAQVAEDRALARRAICLISYAQRPLTVVELCHAVAIEPGSEQVDKDGIYDIDDIISVCAGLLTIENSSVVRLVHYTTQEYLERVRQDWNPTAEEDIAIACLTYVSFSAFKTGSCDSDGALTARVAQNPFLEYSAGHWYKHVKPVEQVQLVSNLAFDFLCNDALVRSTVQVSQTGGGRTVDSNNFRQLTNGLHLIAKHGLSGLAKRVLDDGIFGDVNTYDSDHGFGQTAIHWATENGHDEIVRLLLETGKVTVDQTDLIGDTALVKAASNGHSSIVRLLCATDHVNVNAVNHEGIPSIAKAAQMGHESVVNLLLETGKVDVDMKDNSGWTALMHAAHGGHQAMARLLLGTGKVDVNAKEKWPGQSILAIVAATQNEEMVRLLLDTGQIDVNQKDRWRGETALMKAAARGSEEVVRALLETGVVEVELENDFGRTALMIAAEWGHLSVVKMLRTFGATGVVL